MSPRATWFLTTGALVAVLMASWLVPPGRAKTYDRCELARDLLHKYKLPANEISQWICLVRWESEFNTSAIGSLNADGSLDHGLFQISDLFWCDHGQGWDGACGLTCDALRDDDIKDDVICAKRIFRQHKHLTGNGFNAWVAWRTHCQRDTDSYTADCSLLKNDSEADRERKPQLVAQAANPQTPAEEQQQQQEEPQSQTWQWLWLPISRAFPTGWLLF